MFCFEKTSPGEAHKVRVDSKISRESILSISGLLRWYTFVPEPYETRFTCKVQEPELRFIFLDSKFWQC